MVQPKGDERTLDSPAQLARTAITKDRIRIAEHEVRFAELAGRLVDMIGQLEKLPIDDAHALDVESRNGWLSKR